MCDLDVVCKVMKNVKLVDDKNRRSKSGCSFDYHKWKLEFIDIGFAS